MMAQEEIPKGVEKETQILSKENFEQVNLGANLGSLKLVFISSQLSAQEKEQLVELLKKYVNVFSWTYDEILAWIPDWWSILLMLI